MINHKLMRWLVVQKLRCDMGVSFLTIVNTILLVKAIHLPWWCFFLPIIIVWTGGFALDKLKYLNHYQDETNLRNKMLVDAIKK